jgi:hypothetical protein
MRPDGIGLFGSLIASTCRSNQSFTAWLVPQTIGPASSNPATTSGQCARNAAPDETTPQKNAQIGANHVTGFNNSKHVFKSGIFAGSDIVKATFWSAAKIFPLNLRKFYSRLIVSGSINPCRRIFT